MSSTGWFAVSQRLPSRVWDKLFWFVSEVLNKLKSDIVAAQESWQREGSIIEVQGYKWLGKPRRYRIARGGTEVLDS